MKTLVESRADVNALYRHREPPPHFVARNGNSAIAAYLLKNGYTVPVPPAISAKLSGADPVKGEALFVKQCQICHDVTRRIQNYREPPQWGIVGRPKSAFAEFNYSTPMKGLGGNWTYEDLNKFLSDPARVLPGTELERADIIAYFRSLSDKPVPLP